MATSILRASDHNTNLTLSEDLQTTRHDHHQGAATQSGSARRRSSRVNENHKKKQPQRGMGVAQLERLRLQDQRWKKVTEINNTTNNKNSSSKSPPPPLPYTFIPSSFADPTALNDVPTHFAKFSGLGTSASGVGLNLMQQGLLVQRVGSNSSADLFHGQGLVSEDKFHGYLYAVGNVNENSKELSSTPNVVKCYADCHKKKRNVTGESVFHGAKDIYTDMPSITCSDFVGLNAGSCSQNIKGGNQNFGKKTTLHAGTSAVGNSDQGGVELVALHRKGSPGGGSVLMEYEFFPGKGGRGDCDNELMMMKLGSSSETLSVAEASCVPTTTTTRGGGVIDASSTSIDLSLKLSY